MTIKSFDLAWIIVSDIGAAKKFFVDTLGMKMHTYDDVYGWLELSGQEGGSIIGVAKANEKNGMEAGKNAIITLTVDNVEKSKAELLKKGVNMVGEIMEVPGHVKLQLFRDSDGNLFQLVQSLS
jgi:predicted enzyme related to lactoylglutathione lyase